MLGAAAESVFATVFPSNCRFCDAPLLKVSRVPVCDACLAAIRTLDESVCSVCGERLLSPHVQDMEARCGACRRLEPPYLRAKAYGGYEGGLRDLIHLLKYEHVRPAANLLGRMLGEVLTSLLPEASAEAPLVVPIPLHPSKLRQRGFNQSEMIVRAALGMPGLPSLKLNTTALVRQRATESQTGLMRHQRRQNLRGAFRVVGPNEICGRDILLVDDVFTTGTTVSECARVLRRAGAERIWVATVARVLRPEAGHALDQHHIATMEVTAPLVKAAHA